MPPMLLLMAAVCCALLVPACLGNMGDAAPYIGPDAGSPACTLGPLPGYFETFYAAVNTMLFPGACGRCLWVQGATRTPFIVRVVDDCPTCTEGEVDLSSQAFHAVTGCQEGLHLVSWEWADSCNDPASPSTLSSASASATSGNRRLLGKGSPSAADIKRDLMRSDGREAGDLTDWVLECKGGRRRCPNLFLASWGYQCTNKPGNSCCLRPNGKDCTRLARWEDADTPKGWMGRDLAGSGHSKDDSKDGKDGKAEQAARDGDKTDDDDEVEDREEGQDEQGGRATSQSIDDPERDSGRDGSSSGGQWAEASATVYWSYPDCCHDPTADQTECEQYSGCKWEGYFAGLVGKQPKSWVKSNDIAAFFETPNSQNRKEWEHKWKNKRLRIRDPDTGKTMEVRIVDTCDDSDCDGCCTRNANKNGGQLVDLEYHTAKRFWGKEGGAHVLRRVQYQVV